VLLVFDVLALSGSDLRDGPPVEGAQMLTAQLQISDETAAALKGEERRRVQAGCFLGHIAYASLIARTCSSVRER
jgi:hypothetical protein